MHTFKFQASDNRLINVCVSAASIIKYHRFYYKTYIIHNDVSYECTWLLLLLAYSRLTGPAISQSGNIERKTSQPLNRC